MSKLLEEGPLCYYAKKGLSCETALFTAHRLNGWLKPMTSDHCVVVFRGMSHMVGEMRVWIYARKRLVELMQGFHRLWGDMAMVNQCNRGNLVGKGRMSFVVRLPERLIVHHRRMVLMELGLLAMELCLLIVGLGMVMMKLCMTLVSMGQIMMFLWTRIHLALLLIAFIWFSSSLPLQVCPIMDRKCLRESKPC